jgi:hypothetical protein
MSLPPSRLSPAALFEAIQTLTLEHLGDVVVYRVRVGRLLRDHLFDGGAADQAEGSFRAFARTYRVQLLAWGLGEATLRRCVAAAEVAEELPEETLRRLDFSHLWTARQIQDPAWRDALVRHAAENQWSVAEFRQAIANADAGMEGTDADPDRPGVQPLVPEPEPQPAKPSAPLRAGGVLRRFRQTAGVLDALVADVARGQTRPLTKKQAQEAWAAIEHMEARLAMLKARLKGRGEP